MRESTFMRHLSAVGLEGDYSSTDRSDYSRIYIRTGEIKLGHATFFKRKLSRIKWYRTKDATTLYAAEKLKHYKRTGKVLTVQEWFKKQE